MSYKILEDVATADVAFEAEGETLEELYKSSAEATSNIMVSLDTLEENIEKTFSVTGDNPEKLLFNFLNELIFIKDADLLIFKSFDIKIDKNKLECTAKGDKLNHESQKHGVDVKAVTYHMFKVEQVNDNWKAFVILDI